MSLSIKKNIFCLLQPVTPIYRSASLHPSPTRVSTCNSSNTTSYLLQPLTSIYPETVICIVVSDLSCYFITLLPNKSVTCNNSNTTSCLLQSLTSIYRTTSSPSSHNKSVTPNKSNTTSYVLQPLTSIARTTSLHSSATTVSLAITVTPLPVYCSLWRRFIVLLHHPPPTTRVSLPIKITPLPMYCSLWRRLLVLLHYTPPQQQCHSQWK